MGKDYLTPTEVAALLMVSPVTVRQWAQKGRLEARTTAGGHRRFPIAAVRRLAAEMGLTLPNPVESKPCLLIVDDDRQFNGFLVTLFSQRYPGVDVSAAYDGFEAGIKLQRRKPTVVLLDVMMPGIDGVDVCRTIKADPQMQDIRVVAMTGHYTPELERRVREAGAEQLLKKPFGTDEVLAACALQVETSD